MRFKKIFRPFGDVPVFLAMRGIYGLGEMLPLFCYRPAARLLAAAGFACAGKVRRLILHNMFVALADEYSFTQRRMLAFRLFEEMILSFIELAYFARITGKQWQRFVRIENVELLREALRRGNGVVAVCAHLGNFPLMQSTLSQCGFPVINIARYSNNRYATRMELDWRKKVGMPGIAKWNIRDTIVESLRWLKQGNLLCLYMDQHAGNGVKVRFFGRPVLVPTGISVFARKCDCPVVGIFSHREQDGTHRIIVEGPYPLRKTADVNADHIANTAYYMGRIEARVRHHPEQWFSWFSNRFREVQAEGKTGRNERR